MPVMASQWSRQHEAEQRIFLVLGREAEAGVFEVEDDHVVGFAALGSMPSVSPKRSRPASSETRAGPPPSSRTRAALVALSGLVFGDITVQAVVFPDEPSAASRGFLASYSHCVRGLHSRQNALSWSPSGLLISPNDSRK